jgi:hypothetical protein
MKLNRLLLLAFAAIFAGHASAQSISSRFVVRISETWLTTHATAGPNNVGNCLLVMPNGRMHLELRRQEFFDGKVSLKTYESTLDSEAMERLRSILDEATVRALPPPDEPEVRMNAQAIEGFTAEIARLGGVQKVGYSIWHGEGLNNQTTVGKEANSALKPLVEWSHAAKSSKDWRPVPNPKTLCRE